MNRVGNNNHMFCWACQYHYCYLFRKGVRHGSQHYGPKECKIAQIGIVLDYPDNLHNISVWCVYVLSIFLITYIFCFIFAFECCQVYFCLCLVSVYIPVISKIYFYLPLGIYQLPKTIFLGKMKFNF